VDRVSVTGATTYGVGAQSQARVVVRQTRVEGVFPSDEDSVETASLLWANDAVLDAERVFLVMRETGLTHGALASTARSELHLRDAWIGRVEARDDRAPYVGLSVIRGAYLDARRVIVDRAGDAGLLGDALATETTRGIVLEDVVVRDTRGSSVGAYRSGPLGGTGVHLVDVRVRRADRLVIDGTAGRGLTAGGLYANAQLFDTVIRDVGRTHADSAIRVERAAQLTIRGLALQHDRSPALWASMGSVATLHDAWLGRTEASDAAGAELRVDSNARIRGVRLAGRGIAGVRAENRRTRVELEDFVLLEPRASGAARAVIDVSDYARTRLIRGWIDGASGPVLVASDSARPTIRHVRITDSAVSSEAGAVLGFLDAAEATVGPIVVAGAGGSGLEARGDDTTLTLANARIERVNAAGKSIGAGLVVTDSARATLTDTAVAQTRGMGIRVGSGAHFEADGLFVSEPRPDGSGRRGWGVAASDALRVELRHFIVAGSREHGVFLDGCQAVELDDGIIEGTESSAFDGAQGIGLRLRGAPAESSSERLLLAGHRGYGVLLEGSHLDARDLEVRAVASPRCAELGTCSDSVAHGIGLTAAAELTMGSARVRGADACGVLVIDPAALKAEGVTLEANGTAICGAPALEQLLTDRCTHLLDNQRRSWLTEDEIAPTDLIPGRF